MTQYTWNEKIKILINSFHMIGFWMTIRYCIIHLLGYLPANDTSFDKKFSTDTSGLISSRDLTIQDSISRHSAIIYLPAPESVTVHMIKSINIPHRDFTFIDVGSGKGRIVLIASCFPFQAIIGIEISRQLHEIALKNIKQAVNPSKQCFNIHMHCMNALEFTPPETPVVFHFYHPFLPDILRPMLKIIGQSISQNPRPIYIIYLYAVDYAQAVFEDMPFLEKIKEIKCVNSQYNWALYAGKTTFRKSIDIDLPPIENRQGQTGIQKTANALPRTIQ